MSFSKNSRYTARPISCRSYAKNKKTRTCIYHPRLKTIRKVLLVIRHPLLMKQELNNHLLQASAQKLKVPPSVQQKFRLKLTLRTKANEKSEIESNNLGRKGNNDLHRICGANKPPGKTKTMQWVDCDICHACEKQLCGKRRILLEDYSAKKLYNVCNV